MGRLTTAKLPASRGRYDFPFYDVNPNTREELGKHTHMKTAINTIYHGPNHPSALILPLAQE